jgi:hypothetical protein
MSTGRWSELSAEHAFRYTWNGSSFVTAMSKISEVAMMYGLVVGMSGPNIRQEFPSA